MVFVTVRYPSGMLNCRLFAPIGAPGRKHLPNIVLVHSAGAELVMVTAEEGEDTLAFQQVSEAVVISVIAAQIVVVEQVDPDSSLGPFVKNMLAIKTAWIYVPLCLC